MFTRRSDARDAVVLPASQPANGHGQTQNGYGATGAGAPSFVEPNRGYAAAAVSEESLIGSDLTITGNVICQGSVRLEGRIEGDMRCATLVVGETASVTGTIVADEVAVYGRVAGTVKGRRVNLYSSAHVEGDIFHQGIGIEMGTHYDGRLKWSENPTETQQ